MFSLFLLNFFDVDKQKVRCLRLYNDFLDRKQRSVQNWRQNAKQYNEKVDRTKIKSPKVRHNARLIATHSFVVMVLSADLLLVNCNYQPCFTFGIMYAGQWITILYFQGQFALVELMVFTVGSVAQT